MSYEVPQDIKDRATRCERGLACTKEQGKPYCEVQDMIGHEMVWVSCQHPEPCAYQQAFGSGYVCTCPVRLAIWESQRR